MHKILIVGAIVTSVAMGAGTPGTTVSAGTDSGPHPWVGQFTLTREVWQDGTARQLFVQLPPPPSGGPPPPDPCATAGPGPDSVFLVGALDEFGPQGTAIVVDLGPPPGVVFAEPHHDDIVPSQLVGIDHKANACGFVLVPGPAAGDDVATRAGNPAWSAIPQWAFAVRSDDSTPFDPIDTTTEAVNGLTTGVLAAVPIGSGGVSWTAKCTVSGTAGHDVLVGTSGDDVICGLGGNDVLIGLGGHDILLGGAGNDVLAGGAAGDILVGGYGSDWVFGGPGDDVAYGGWGYVPGADPANPFPPPDPTMPSDGNDVLDGGPGADTGFGGYGNDVLLGRADQLTGGFGRDVCAGSSTDC